MSDDEGIRAKVAQLLNSTDLALNKGATHGVEVGMKFAILDPIGRDIEDPETHEVIGSVDIAKTVLKIVRVEPGLSVARTFRSRQSGLGLGALAGITGTKEETLRSDERRLQQMLDPKDSKVKVGDTAVQYSGEFGGLVLDF
ncbi:hypothetical protein [Curtobacterium sp. MCLR17_042]|jgi:hypothetical protein|uniref:hypothetical protein n=1 Tax=Curtobacterium sp. MCLR17_042 TaxID=2175626 RepID=UPI000DA7BD97|nr:hypothetical protein [Curtobacterium sp. MCLR17_042]PZE26692.1 hypothetical protein DEJ02_11375 [Curtobacterium sp. MCLR17_042]